MRVALLLVALVAACQKPVDDPVVGRWRGESGKTIELRGDGTLDMDPGVAPECNNAPLAACRASQTWHRSGSTVAVSRGVVRGTPCTCHLERIDLQFRGGELIYGTEHIQRVKSAN